MYVNKIFLDFQSKMVLDLKQIILREKKKSGKQFKKKRIWVGLEFWNHVYYAKISEMIISAEVGLLKPHHLSPRRGSF